MTIKATIRNGYLMRVAILAVALLLFGVWFLRDGYVNYPKQNEIYEAYHEIRLQYDGYADKYDRIAAEWQRVAEQHEGWPLVVEDLSYGPGKKHTASDMFTQKLIGYTCLPLGLLFTISLLRQFGRWIAVNDDGLTVRGGRRIPFDAITTLNKARWQSKGIAVLTYQHANRSKRLVLDDWKYQRQPMVAIEKYVEQHISPDKITGQPTAPATLAE